jgi:tRNA (guanine-N7-)-methyltransferase
MNNIETEKNRRRSCSGGEGRAIKSYVLRSGRMSAAQKRCYEEFFPHYGLSFPHPLQPLDFTRLFGNTNPVTLEIGFGMGVATAMIAESNREQNYLGVEVHRPGIGRLLWEIDKRRLSNIRIIEYDAVEVLRGLIADASLSGIHVFFPDPWPKKRHRKRRLITRPFTDLLAQKLKTGAYVYMVTDWEDYAQWALRELSATPALRNPYAVNPGGFASPQVWRPETKFERKGREKSHLIWELFFNKRVQ